MLDPSGAIRGRLAWVLAALFVGGTIVLFGYSMHRQSTLDDAAARVVTAVAADVKRAEAQSFPQGSTADAAIAPQEQVSSAEAIATEASAPEIIAPETVERWIADATSGDAAKRAEAIVGLAQAPKSQALPVLRRVLTNGEPVADRPLALRSLRDLALHQGDADGRVREVVREAIYHGDDDALALSAQEVLDVIEESVLQ